MNISTNKKLSFVFWPLIKICEWMGRNAPTTLVRIRYFAKFKRFPRLKNPQDLNEKILWLKLYSDTSRWTELADKFLVRTYLEKIGMGKYLVRLYGKWDDIREINFESLPNDVIFKANNGDGKGTNLIVRNLRQANCETLIKILDSWLKRKNIGDLSAEPQYKNIKPCIIAEEVLKLPEGSSSLIDYKIWCINGEPQCIFTCSERDEDGCGASVLAYDLSWKAHPEYSVFTHEYPRAKVLPKPQNLDEMLEIAGKLSQDFPILRVDLYNIDGQIYFGEMTFTSLGGMMDYFTEEYLMELGQKADISHVKRK